MDEQEEEEVCVCVCVFCSHDSCVFESLFTWISVGKQRLLWRWKKFKVEAISFIISGQREQNTGILNPSSDTTSKRKKSKMIFNLIFNLNTEKNIK